MSFADRFLRSMTLDSRVITTSGSQPKPSFREVEVQRQRQQQQRAVQRALWEAQEVSRGAQWAVPLSVGWRGVLTLPWAF